MSALKKVKTPKISWNLISKYRMELFGLAAVFVMLQHSHRLIWTSQLLVLDQIAGQINGIDIFIFLSGVGLYYSYNRNPDIRNYFKRRMQRILPAYLTVAIPFYLIKTVVFKYPIKYSLMGILTIDYWFFDSIFWYIPFIMVLYGLFPLLNKYILNNKYRTISFLIIWVCATILFCVLFGWKGQHILRGLTRIPVFVLGACCSRAVFEKREVSVIFPAVCIVIYLLLTVISYVVFHNLPGIPESTARALSLLITIYSYIFISYAVMLFVPAAMERITWLKPIRIGLAWLGEFSLEIYLVHCAIKELYLNTNFGKAHQQAAYYFLLILPISIVLAAGIKRLLKPGYLLRCLPQK